MYKGKTRKKIIETISGVLIAKSRHTRYCCYKLHGKPRNSKNCVSQVHMITDSSSNQKSDLTNPRNIDSAPSRDIEGLHRELKQLKEMVKQQSQPSFPWCLRSIPRHYWMLGNRLESNRPHDKSFISVPHRHPMP